MTEGNADVKNNRTRVTVIVLNWNGWPDTVKCLETLRANTYPSFEVVVVDNGSDDRSVPELSRWLERSGSRSLQTPSATLHAAAALSRFRFVDAREIPPGGGSTVPLAVTLLASDANLGYAGGNNIGLAWAVAAGSRYAVIVNNDIKVDPGFIGNLVAAAEEKDACIIGALIKDYAGHAIVFARSSFPAMFFYTESQPAAIDARLWPSDRLSGEAMLMRRDLLLKRRKMVDHFLDESLFLYCEEIELASWCRQQGIRSFVAGDAIAYHKVGGSTGGKGHPRQFYYLTRNRILLAIRFLPLPWLVLFALGYPLWRSARAGAALLQRRPATAAAIILGLRDGIMAKTGKCRP